MGKNGRQRKYYGLTSKGKKVAQDAQRNWVFFTTAVNAILAGGSSGAPDFGQGALQSAGGTDVYVADLGP